MAVPVSGSIRSSNPVFALALVGIVAAAAMGTMAAQSMRKGTGEVVAVRELEVKPGADIGAFERFVVERYNPAWEGAVPGMRGYVARADRGANKGRYAFVLVFDSERTRDAIFPKEGAGASASFQPLLDEPLRLNKELDQYIEPGSFSVYTDYVALR